VTDDLPLPLRTAIESGNCVLFLGAGIGAHARDAEGNPAPDATTLARELAAHFSIEAEGEDQPDLAKIAQIVELRKGRAELQAFLAERLASLQPDETLRWLFTLTWKAIFTTNYDRLIERSYELIADSPQTPVTISASSEMVSYDPRFEVPVYHLHGSLFVAGTSHILITQEDYARFREQRRMLFELLKYNFATTPMLYIGYSQRDPNWRMVLTELRAEFSPSAPPDSYRVAPQTDPLDKEIFRAQGIHTLDLTLERFSAVTTASLGAIRVDPRRLTQLQDSVPSDLHKSFDQSPAAVARLLNAWTYVNQAPFEEAPNVRAYLKGDLPNWGLVAQKIQFERDIEEPIFDELLDYATTPEPNQRVHLVIGPAGYGVSTILMSLAARLAKERAGRIFVHRRGAPLIEADVEFASSIFSEPIFFVVDNAADSAQVLQTLVVRLRDSKTPACFLLGERLNEWRQRRVRLPAREYAVEPLSNEEIERLLDCLERQHALGKLANLARPFQIAAVQVRHQQQLLVAMKEATEGEAFGAIIEDEYSQIGDEFSRRLYAAVCCFYRLRVYARDMLLASLLKVPITELYDRTRSTTEGVVIYDCIDEAQQTYAARARHHVIAEIVWERAVDADEKERLMLEAMRTLNINYHSDITAFEALVRADDAVDSIRSFEGKIQFFEAACRKHPFDPYVRQHYARMLRREDALELALQQVDKGLEIDPGVRVLYHTKGIVLKDLALQTDSAEIARRRLAQSEEAFRRVLAINERDEYGYQGLAELYLGWAKRAGSYDEGVRYIAKAEETISEGLRVVRSREGLWIISSQIQEWLGNRPAAIQSLEEAVASSPGSVISRYLLGRSHLTAGDPERALEILGPVIEGHPEEYRSCIVYARALYDLSNPLPECIAVLRLGSLYGMRDPRYIATLGGMLFLNREFTEAEKVFAESEQRNFAFEEARRLEFAPHDSNEPSEPMALVGRVVSVRSGYAFIRAPGYPDLFCPGSKFGSLMMRIGMEVSVGLGFSARGPIASDPQQL
jgi:tetratricopeptide (TPR) repeat protein